MTDVESATCETSPMDNTNNKTDEDTSLEDYVQPICKDGESILDIECGGNRAMLYLSKLCQGSKGRCILFNETWLTPNEFQFVSGRETAKDWKRSIRHNGKSIKLLLTKGAISVHPTVCDCSECRATSPVVSTPRSYTPIYPDTSLRLPSATTLLSSDSNRSQAKLIGDFMSLFYGYRCCC